MNFVKPIDIFSLSSLKDRNDLLEVFGTAISLWEYYVNTLPIFPEKSRCISNN